MTQVAREALRRLNTILGDNSASLHTTITNLETFSGVLASNSDRLDGILAGIERMTGGAPAKPPPVYDLTAPRAFPASAKPPRGQLVVPEPTASVTLETQKILIRFNAGQTSFLDHGQWRTAALLMRASSARRLLPSQRMRRQPPLRSTRRSEKPRLTSLFGARPSFRGRMR
jgi:hypothetical protein